MVTRRLMVNWPIHSSGLSSFPQGFLFRKLQISILQIIGIFSLSQISILHLIFHFVNLQIISIFPFPKFANQKHISVSQITDFHFVSFRFANYIKPLERASDKLGSEKRPSKISRHNHTTDLSHVLITWKNLPFRKMKTNDCSLFIVA